MMAGIWLINKTGATAVRGQVVKVNTISNSYSTATDYLDPLTCGVVLVNTNADALGPVSISGMPLVYYGATTPQLGYMLSPDNNNLTRIRPWPHSPNFSLGVAAQQVSASSEGRAVLIPGGSGCSDVQSSFPATGHAEGHRVWETTNKKIGVWTGTAWQEIKLSTTADFSELDYNTQSFYCDDFIGDAIRDEWHVPTGDTAPSLETTESLRKNGVLVLATDGTLNDSSAVDWDTYYNIHLTGFPVIEIRAAFDEVGSGSNSIHWIGLYYGGSPVQRVVIGNWDDATKYPADFIVRVSDQTPENDVTTDLEITADTNWHTWKIEFISTSEFNVYQDNTFIKNISGKSFNTTIFGPWLQAYATATAVKTTRVDYIKIFGTR